MSDKILFVIPHRGREVLLRQTLESIAGQNYPKSQISVVVVTQNVNLEQATRECIDSLTGTLVQRPQTDTISAMRNIGVKMGNAEYLAFLDADVHLAPNWISVMLATLAENTARVMASAVQTCSPHAPILEKIRTELSNINVDCNMQFLPGRNLFLRRISFERAGGFPEHLVTCEDYYFTQKVAEQGALYYTSMSSYIHLGEDKAFDSMFRKEIWRGQSNLQSLGGRTIPFSEIPSFLVPVWFSVFAIACVFSMLFLGLAVTLLFFLLTVLPVVLYSWRLFTCANTKLPYIDIVRFYMLYFPARFLGTVVGLFRLVKI